MNAVLAIDIQNIDMEVVSVSDDKEFVSVKEAAKMLEMNARTLTRWVAAGYFPNARRDNPFATRGAAYKIPRADVLEAIQKKNAPIGGDEEKAD